LARKGRIRAARGAAAEVAVDLPDWIPRSVGDLAQIKSDDLHRQRAEPEILELLRRLTSDTRMKNVWNELQRRKRQDYERTEAFVHPASQTSWTSQATSGRRRAVQLRKLGGSENAAEADRLELSAAAAEVGVRMLLFPWHRGRPELPLQDLSMAFLFDQAFTFGRQNIRPVPIREANNTRRRFLKMAEQIRADAAEQERLKRYVDRRLWGAAFAYEELADAAAPPPGSPLLVERQHRNNQRMQGFVMALAGTTSQVFGAPLCGTVATVANVVLGRDDLTAEKVRKMLPRVLRP
jgi:hypothetical protein